MAIFLDEFTEGYEAADYPLEVADSLLLARKRVPGAKVEVRGISKKRLEISKKSGGDGATVIDKGFEPAKIDITVTLNTPAHFELWEELEAAIWRRAGKDSRQARGKKGATKVEGAIEFSSARLRRVTHVIIESVSGYEPASEARAWVKKLSAVEYIKPTANQTSKAEGAAPKVALDPAIVRAKNAAGAKPSTTDGLPKLPPAKQSGSS